MKRFRFMPKLAAAIVSAAMIFSGAVPAFADGANNKGINKLEKNTVYFDATLNMEVEKSASGITPTVPNVTFSYNVINGEAESKSSNDTTTSIKKGFGFDTAQSFTATKSQDYSKISEETNEKNVITETGKVVYQVAIPFTNVNFTEPGIYHYVVTDKTTLGQGFDTSGHVNTRDLYISVVDQDGKYVINDATMTTTGSDGKGTGFSYNYKAKYLKFTKKIAGNQATLSDRFEFNMAISNVDQNVTVSYNNVFADPKASDALPGETLNPSNKVVSKSFYMTNLSSVAVDNIPSGYKIKITEAPGNYSASLDKDKNLSSLSLIDNTLSVNDPITSSVYFTVINTKEGTVPTGVIFAVAPFAIGAVAIAAFVILKVRKAAKQ
ncbi:MAG: hypothetical protein ACI32Q_05970 [Intestinibaculum porci]|uniref:DUF7601 domain-containing protein n=1 Tax=Intestinibaculum porci TaxID=2487118 RepID=UPI003F0EBAFD